MKCTLMKCSQLTRGIDVVLQSKQEGCFLVAGVDETLNVSRLFVVGAGARRDASVTPHFLSAILLQG
jgi:hypothetical protein